MSVPALVEHKDFLTWLNIGLTLRAGINQGDYLKELNEELQAEQYAMYAEIERVKERVRPQK